MAKSKKTKKTKKRGRGRPKGNGKKKGKGKKKRQKKEVLTGPPVVEPLFQYGPISITKRIARFKDAGVRSIYYEVKADSSSISHQCKDLQTAFFTAGRLFERCTGFNVLKPSWHIDNVEAGKRCNLDPDEYA